MGAWPCGTVVMVGELYGAESKSQVYGTIHTFLQENQQATNELGKILNTCVNYKIVIFSPMQYLLL